MAVKIWMSGEIETDVADSYRSARNDIEPMINNVLALGEYGPNLRKWAFLAIILHQDDPRYKEVKKYRKKLREFESRLKIPYIAFKNAAPVHQRRLIISAMLRSISEMRTLEIPSVDYDKLERDITGAATDNDWLDVP